MISALTSELYCTLWIWVVALDVSDGTSPQYGADLRSIHFGLTDLDMSFLC